MMNMTSIKVYIPLDITEKQRENLELLYKNSPQTTEVEFDMGDFLYNRNLTESISINSIETEQPYLTCGTVACFAGRGPLCGIIPDKNDLSWWSYVKNKFGILGYLDSSSSSWYWLFDAAWTDTDNTLEGARKRLRIALDKGIPTDSYDQLRGRVDLEYEN